jgi:signal transduction histidine kinase
VANSSQLTVLTVDDNDALRYSVARCLKQGGYIVTEARTGGEALALARENPALITLDINLPDISGFEVCRRLKQSPETAHIPVLHISASFVRAEHRIRGLEGGADAYLVEPIDSEELLATARTLIRIRQAEKEARREAQEAEAVKQQLRTVNQDLELRVRERTVELQRRNSEVQELSRRLLRAQDQERRRLARELHDSTGQLLVTLTVNLSLLKSEVETVNPRVEQLISEVNSTAQEINRQLRTLSYLLHPPLLDEAGLVSALEWYIDGFTRRSDIQVTLDVPASLERYAPDMEITIFRIIQESLTNIHRHSGSKTALVRIIHDSEQVRLEIVDQGKGIQGGEHGSEASPARPGVGILGMRERVRQFGGTFDFSSGASGTLTVVTLPIPEIVEELEAQSKDTLLN